MKSVLWIAVMALLVADPGWAGRRRRPPPPAPAVLAALAFLDARAGASGLLDSFPEDGADHAYTYDNALAALAYLSAGDVAAAGDVLDALAAVGPEPKGGFLHRYRASDGGDASGLLRVGHNAYVLKALVRYAARSGDASHDPLALQIAGYLLSQQETVDDGTG